MSEKSKKKLLQRIMILVPGVAFLGFMVFPFIRMFHSPSQPQLERAATSETASIAQELQDRESGYELVLEREPENPVALQGLVETRLHMKDFEGAIEPMEKLVELYPEQEELKALLAAIKKQVAEGSQGSEAEQESDRKH
ncbi:MAG: tetratricopeptide repeat protein [Xenococcaceae cyanobacterium]